MATLALTGLAAGGTAAVATTATTLQAVQIGLGFASAAGAIQAGYAQQQALQRQADAEEFAAKERELQRLKNLRKVQASQRAIFAGRGIDYVTGSPQAIRRDSINEYFLERGSDLASTSRTINSLNAAGNQAVTNGWVSGAGIIGNRIGTDWS